MGERLPARSAGHPRLSGEHPALFLRGREIDRGAQADVITLVVRLNPAYRRGHVMEVLDDMFGPPWRGFVTGIQHVARAAQRWLGDTVGRILTTKSGN